MRAKIRPTATLVGCFALFVGTMGHAAGEPPSTLPSNDPMDIIITGGTIVDGTGSPGYPADLGIDDGTIAAIGDLEDRPARTRIDATGKIVAPGFIDIHSHADPDALRDAESALKQGVTTEILSPDGGGTTDIEDALDVAAGGIGINVGAYIGFNAVWREVVGQSDRRPTDAEFDRMRELVATGMKSGAWGVSAGLFYSPRRSPGPTR